LTHITEIKQEKASIEQQIVARMSDLLPEHEGGSMDTIEVRPSVTFDSLNKDEVVFILIRRHVIKNTYWIVRSLIMSIIPPIFIFIANALGGQGALQKFAPLEGWLIVFIGWYLIVLAMTVYSYLAWYYNVWIVTSERIIDIDFMPLIGRKVSETALENVQDVTEVSAFFLASAFNYGNMIVQTAAEQRQFEIRYAPNPSWLRDKILDLANIRKQILNIN
jgi:hypothetical protein